MVASRAGRYGAFEVEGTVVAESLLIRELRERVGRVPAGHRDAWVYRSLDELLLVHGRLFTPAPLSRRYRRLPERQCYANAFAMASVREELTYVEGYAVCDFGDGDLLPLQHAWCVTADGTVVDPTWPTPGVAYLGIPLGPGRGAPSYGPGMTYDIDQLRPVLAEGLTAEELVDVGRPLPVRS